TAARPRHPRTGGQVAPGFVPGTEAVPGGWVPWIRPAPPGPQAQVTTSVIAGFGNSFYGQAGAEDPKWDFRKWNFESGEATHRSRSTRPLCPYPQIARYKGSGDPYLADSFTCALTNH